MRTRIAALARKSVYLNREKSICSTGCSSIGDCSRWLSPLAVLALREEADTLEQFTGEMMDMAATNWGVDDNGIRNRLDDSFAMRSVVEAYHGLIDAGLIDVETQRKLADWLYEFGLAAADGRVAARPNFEHWHLRNQNVPATCVYNVAHLLDETIPGRYDTKPLWKWGDEQIVGWNLTWRDPDDSYLYQFIWNWSAYLHARYRRPDLLESENARKCMAFYKHLDMHGLGVDLVFGDSKPGDLLGPAVSLVLGAVMFDDGESLYLAERKIELIEQQTDPENLADRGPEMYRLYTLWPDHIEPIAPPRESRLICSPLAGRGWTMMDSPYASQVKQNDPRYPHYGKSQTCCDEIYQVQAPAAYAVDQPDKIVFCEGDRPADDVMFALVDLRSQGLHDHADALGVTTLIDQGLPWLVESSYMPRGYTNQRWQHNVPLWLPGEHDAQTLQSWKSDTWLGVVPQDVLFQRQPDLILASAWLRHDGYDFVDFPGQSLDVQRVCIFLPDEAFVVIDQFIAMKDSAVTLGHVWHTTADAIIDSHDRIWGLSRDGKQFHATFTQSFDAGCEMSDRLPTQTDAFHYPPDGMITDLLWSKVLNMRKGQVATMAAAFSRHPMPVELVCSDAGTAELTVAQRQIRIDEQGLVNIASPACK